MGVGLGLGLGDRLVLFDGLGLWLSEGLEVGLCDGLVRCDGLGLLEGLWDELTLPEGLGDCDELGLAVGLVLVPVIMLACTTATDPDEHGELSCVPDDATAGAKADPDSKNNPAPARMTVCPVRMIPIGTTALR